MEMDLIKRIVLSCGIQSGERVLLHFWGDDAQKETANRYLAAIAAVGATPVLLQQSRSINRELFLAATEDCFPESYFSSLAQFDAVLDLFAYRPITLGEELPPAAMERYRRYIRRLFGALTKAKRFLQIRLPTAENAQETNLPEEEFMTRMTRAYDIDYAVLQAACQNRVDVLKELPWLHLHTGNGCVLHVHTAGRTWHTDAGDGDWPCGEIYIAPHENDTWGSVHFPIFLWEDMEQFENVTLTVENGRLMGSSNEAINRQIASLADAERVVCELGFGMNPNVQTLCGYTVLDEKMANSFHIAIGNNRMFGGENEANRHTDFVCTDRFYWTEE